MKVLVICGGGREHALVWKISQSPKVTKIYAAPGNAGIAGLAECAPIKAEDIPGLLAFARAKAVDLTVVGPEGPLSMGIVDEFTKAGLRAFGPSGKAAELEASKRFSKDLMKEYCIPTAEYEVFTDKAAAAAYVNKKGAPIVVKADGLAAGKGVVVAETVEEALRALELIMTEKAYGAAGDRVIIEECLRGEEASFMAFSDGRTVAPMASSQDHKRVFDGDKGPNTGGMGAYSPAPIVTKELEQKAMETIMVPTVRAMEKEGRLIKGVLSEISDAFLNGHPTIRLCNNAHFRFEGLEGESLLMLLDVQGFCVSTGSACSSRTTGPSHVLSGLGLKREQMHGSLRASLSKFNTIEEVDRFIGVAPAIVKRLREMSPMYKAKEC